MQNHACASKAPFLEKHFTVSPALARTCRGFLLGLFVVHPAFLSLFLTSCHYRNSSPVSLVEGGGDLEGWEISSASSPPAATWYLGTCLPFPPACALLVLVSADLSECKRRLPFLLIMHHLYSPPAFYGRHYPFSDLRLTFYLSIWCFL